MKARVVIVGSYVQDLAFYVEAFPGPGDCVLAELRPGAGGKGFNQAVAATRAGAPTLFVGAIGQDSAGAHAREFARRNGVQTEFILKKKEPTGAASIAVNHAGQNQIMVALGANLALHVRDLPVRPLAAADVVLCQAESDMKTAAHVLRVARRHGAVTVFNPAPMHPGVDLAILRHVEVLIPNEAEFVSLVNRSPRSGVKNFTVEALHRLAPDRLHTLCRSFNVPIVIVTLGARGCFVSQPDVYARVQAHEVDPVDTAGAGDAFVGGFAAGLVKFNKNIIEAVHFANAVAALAVTQHGTAPAMPTAREIARFLRRRDHA
ncbi:Ribokinase [Lacunisphaera limnophila]|uniref:Ribokinase n=1 Tax=Lacunisphaera limnophila TaxID=1838286 RepID=A0A1D8ASL0_9BACT|nr:ribokinase [Lacunisphaera limnophila]AOS43883.1 Ribokinase [Lacunisphaera limnophila]